MGHARHIGALPDRAATTALGVYGVESALEKLFKGTRVHAGRA